MSGLPMVRARVTQEWREQIRAIAHSAGRTEAEIVRDAIAQYLGKTDPHSVKGASLEDRVIILERKLGRLAG